MKKYILVVLGVFMMISNIEAKKANYNQKISREVTAITTR